MTIGISIQTAAWQIRGKVSRSLFTLLKEKPPNGKMWFGERLTKVQTTTRPDVWPEVWTKIDKAAQHREKQECKNEKPELDNARRLRRIYFIDFDGQYYKETLKNARRKRKHLWPCRARGWFILAARRWLQSKKLYGGIFFIYKIQRSHCRQRFHFDDPSQCGSQLYSYASSNEDSGRKSCSGQGMEKARDTSSMATGESQE